MIRVVIKVMYHSAEAIVMMSYDVTASHTMRKAE